MPAIQAVPYNSGTVNAVGYQPHGGVRTDVQAQAGHQGVLDVWSAMTAPWEPSEGVFGCAGITKKGEPCPAKLQTGERFCSGHMQAIEAAKRRAEAKAS